MLGTLIANNTVEPFGRRPWSARLLLARSRNTIAISIRRLNIEMGVQQASPIHPSIWRYNPGVLNFLFEYPVPPRPIPSRRLLPASGGGPSELCGLSRRMISDDELGGVDAATDIATLVGEVEGRDASVRVLVEGPAEGRM